MTDVIASLASRVGARGSAANLGVAQRCLREPEALRTVAAHLADADARLAGDCAEVLTKVAERRPDRVAPHARALLTALSHENGRVRWESMHALALIAHLESRAIRRELPLLEHLVRQDASVIVRDYALDALIAYAATGSKAAAATVPLLIESTSAWQGKHAARIMTGLAGLARQVPALRPELRAVALRHATHARVGVQKAARILLARVEVEGSLGPRTRRKAPPAR